MSGQNIRLPEFEGVCDVRIEIQNPIYHHIMILRLFWASNAFSNHFTKWKIQSFAAKRRFIAAVFCTNSWIFRRYFADRKKILKFLLRNVTSTQIRIGYDRFERHPINDDRRPSNVYKLKHQYNTTLPVEIMTSAGPSQKDLALNVDYLQQFFWSLTPPQPARISPQSFDEIIDVGRASLRRQATAQPLGDFVTIN